MDRTNRSYLDGRHNASRFKLALNYMKNLLFKNDTNVSSLFNNFFLDPIFWFIDHYLKFFGPFFVVVVFVMLAVFVLIAYAIGIPYWYDRSPTVLVFAFIIGHWLLLNVSWNYYKALTTEPGFPTENSLIAEFMPLCKKCIEPKPPRAHHCSVCNRCILKMDHHCPWLNKCIGHFNHRYFFFFCIYTWIGTIFVMLFGVWVFIDHFFPSFTIFKDYFYYDSDLQEYNDVYSFIGLFDISSARVRHKCIVTEAIISVLLFILLGVLLHYHCTLITNGETCIERHENNSFRERYKRNNRIYINPYDFGARANWRSFLGFDRNSNPWCSILLPSSFSPIGDGFSWRTIYDDT